MEAKKRTISLDAGDESLIAQIVDKNRPFATAHAVARAALKRGLRLLDEDITAIHEDLGPTSKAGER